MVPDQYIVSSQLSSPSFMGRVCGTSKQLQSYHQRSQITITNVIIMKRCEILWDLTNVTETQSEQVLFEKVNKTCLIQGCHKPSVVKNTVFLKHMKVKYNGMRYVYKISYFKMNSWMTFSIIHSQRRSMIFI